MTTDSDGKAIDGETPETNFASRLKALREKRGLTQAQLGSMIGLTENAITQYETGRASPRRARFLTIASALGVSVNVLLAGKENDSDLSATEQELLRLMKTIPEPKRRFAIRAVKILSEAFTSDQEKKR